MEKTKKEYYREYREKNKNKIRKYQREYMKKYRQQNRDKISKQNKTYWIKKDIENENMTAEEINLDRIATFLKDCGLERVKVAKEKNNVKVAYKRRDSNMIMSIVFEDAKKTRDVIFALFDIV